MAGKMASCYRDSDMEKMIYTYMPLVQRVVGKMMLYGNGLLEKDDMFSLGVIGLIHAVSKFDPTMGVRFEAFAVSRIRGSILDELRKLSWRPRTLLDNMKRITETQDKLAAKDLDWDYATIAQELGETEDHVRSTVAHFNAGVILSFDELVFGQDTGPSRHELVADYREGDPQDNLLAKERLALLTKAINSLGQRDQTVLALYYQEELTLKEIGAVLGVTEGRVCQIHSRVLLKLRTALEKLDQ